MDNLKRIKKHSIIVSILFTIAMTISMIINVSIINKKQKQIALGHAKNAFEKDLIFRRWVSMHGGVYVPPTAETPPNPYLSHIEDRDVVTTKGKKLTLMNPAYTLRELMTNFPGLYGETGHITSLKLINKNNKADTWETRVLQNFDKRKYTEFHEIYDYNGEEQLRYMKALRTEQSCLKCHSHQNYKVGDVRGGISINIPMKIYNNEGTIEKTNIIMLHLILIFVGLIIGLIMFKRITNSMIKEVEFNQKLKIKEDLLIQQSKMAAMGEMIDNIAHQWRQPLSTIAVTSSGIQLKNELDELSKDHITKSMSNIDNSVQHLSQTIQDFRNFFNPNKTKDNFFIEQTFKKTFKLLESQFTTSGIDIVENIDDIEVFGYENELIQVFMNILNNARDELIKVEEHAKFIFIDILKNDETIQIIIKDNAGGIPEDIIDKVMDFRFTTKAESKGTGIGLYMSRLIVTEHMNGNIEVHNQNFVHEDNAYTGAEFIITLPLPTS